MIDQSHQFKIDHVEEYLKVALEAFKQNSPTFKNNRLKDDDFISKSKSLILLLLEIEAQFNK